MNGTRFIFRICALPVLFLFGCIEGEQGCHSFHEGNFYAVGDQNDTIFIERSEDKQIERHHNSEDSLKIFWKTNCEFILRAYSNPSMEGTSQEGDIVGTITECNKDFYVYESAKLGESIQSGKMYRAKE